MASTPTRRIAGILLAVPLLLVAAAGAAHAEDGYRYWNYFHAQDGAWTFATKGVGATTPADGAVEGFRYGTSTTSRGLEPRADLSTLTFDTVCPDPAPAGKKRVAIVIDYGTAADAGGQEIPEPTAACAVVPQDATTLQALGTVAKTRTSKAMLCGIDGYPARGCGDPVADATVPESEPTVGFTVAAADAGVDPDGGYGLAWPLVGVGAAVVVIGGGAVAVNRRNRAA